MLSDGHSKKQKQDFSIENDNENINKKQKSS